MSSDIALTNLLTSVDPSIATSFDAVSIESDQVLSESVIDLFEVAASVFKEEGDAESRLLNNSPFDISITAAAIAAFQEIGTTADGSSSFLSLVLPEKTLLTGRVITDSPTTLLSNLSILQELTEKGNVTLTINQSDVEASFRELSNQLSQH